MSRCGYLNEMQSAVHFRYITICWQLTIGAEAAKIPATRKVIIYKEKREP